MRYLLDVLRAQLRPEPLGLQSKEALRRIAPTLTPFSVEHGTIDSTIEPRESRSRMARLTLGSAGVADALEEMSEGRLSMML